MYGAFLSSELVAQLADSACAVDGVPGLQVTPELLQDFPDIESPEILKAVVEVFREVQSGLETVLAQREVDRAFVDAFLKRQGSSQLIGARDDSGRMVIGPHPERLKMRSVTVPDFMAGPQITLFGPQMTPKMSINAMNALHRQHPVKIRLSPAWSKTPVMSRDGGPTRRTPRHRWRAICAWPLGI